MTQSRARVPNTHVQAGGLLCNRRAASASCAPATTNAAPSSTPSQLRFIRSSTLAAASLPGSCQLIVDEVHSSVPRFMHFGSGIRQKSVGGRKLIVRTRNQAVLTSTSRVESIQTHPKLSLFTGRPPGAFFRTTPPAAPARASRHTHQFGARSP